MENIICPFCNGAGCPNCEQSGQMQVSPQEIQQLQAMMQSPMANPYAPPAIQPQTQPVPSTQKIIPGSRITMFEIKTKTAGFFAFLFILLLAGGAYLSDRFLGTFKPYAAFLVSLIIIFLSLYLLKIPFFRYQEPTDFLAAVKQNKPSKNTSV